MGQPTKPREATVFRRVAPALGLLLGLAPTLAHAQVSIDQGKTPAEMFANDCATCHKGARGLAHGKTSSELASFLSEHYTASRDEAASLAAYVMGAGGGDAAPTARGPKNPPDRGSASTEAKPDTKPPARPGKPTGKPEEGQQPATARLRPEEEKKPPGAVTSPAERQSPSANRNRRGEPTPAEQPAAVAAPAPSSAPAEESNPPPAPAQSAAAPASPDSGDGAPVPRDNIPD
jgi:hypothetical protein